jgi:hypothetical protein
VDDVKPSVQFVSPGVKRPGVKLNTYLYVVLEAQKDALYRHEEAKARGGLQCQFRMSMFVFIRPLHYSFF